MSGDHAVAAQLHGAAHQMLKFQIAVAVNAGIGGGAAFIAADEFGNHLFLKVVREIKHVKGHSQSPGDTSGIFHIIQTAAGGLLIQTQNVVAEQTHGHAGAFIALLLHQKGSHRAVHAAAHGNQRFFFSHAESLQIPSF